MYNGTSPKQQPGTYVHEDVHCPFNRLITEYAINKILTLQCIVNNTVIYDEIILINK